MNLLEKNRSEIILGLLFIESLFLSLVLANKLFFWMLFFLSVITVFFYALLILNIPVKKFMEHEKRDDVFLVLAMTIMLNANISVFQNRLFLALILVAYYLGLRVLVNSFKKNAASQFQKNILNLSVLFTIFLGSNLIINISVIGQKEIGEFVLVPLNLLLFAAIYLLSYYNFIKNKITAKWAKSYSLVLAFILTETSLLSSFYLERYPSIYKVESTTSMSIVTLPLFLIVIYYLVYGLMLHKLENRFTTKVIIEYLSVFSVIIITLFITIKWFAS